MAQPEFSKTVRMSLAQRALYICSNPDCRTMTISLTGDDPPAALYKGRAVAICSTVENGLRYDPRMNGNQRKAIDNAIFLCNKCADVIHHRSKGAGYTADVLRDWKLQHKKWVRTQLNLRPHATVQLTLVQSPPRRAKEDTRALAAVRKR